jgi:hypothetical protein
MPDDLNGDVGEANGKPSNEVSIPSRTNQTLFLNHRTVNENSRR